MRKKRNVFQRLMNEMKKKELKTAAVIFVGITFAFWFLRLRNFEEMMTFHIDQAVHFQESEEMVATGKLRLIGPIVLSRMIEGRGYFIGPQYYYAITLLGLLAGWDAVVMTKMLILLLWWPAAVLLTVWIWKKLSWYGALISYAIFAVQPLLISFSRMVLNPNFLTLISVGFFYFLWKALQKHEKRYWLLAGIFCGLGLSFHFMVLVWIVILLGSWLVSYLLKREKVSHLFLGMVGIIIGDLPYVIFELRHNFYNLRTMASIGVDPNAVGFLGRYYSFGFLPLIFWGIALLFDRIAKRLKPLYTIAIALLVIGATMFIFTKEEYSQKGYGMPRGWTVTTQKYLADVICSDRQRGNFIVAAQVSSVATADDLRWWVRRCGAEPMGRSEYPFAETLYFVDYGAVHNAENPGLWELASMTKDPHDVVFEEPLDGGLWFYKLVRKKT